MRKQLVVSSVSSVVTSTTTGELNITGENNGQLNTFPLVWNIPFK